MDEVSEHMRNEKSIHTGKEIVQFMVSECEKSEESPHSANRAWREMLAPKWSKEGLHTGIGPCYGELESKRVNMTCLSESNMASGVRSELDKEDFQMGWDGGKILETKQGKEGVIQRTCVR